MQQHPLHFHQTQPKILLLLIYICVICVENTAIVQYSSASQGREGIAKLDAYSIADSLKKFNWAVLTKNLNQINSFFQYYAVPEAKFYQNSEIYLGYNKVPVKTQNVILNRTEYGAYIFESINNAIEYTNKMNIESIKIQSADSAVAAITTTEAYELNGDDGDIISVSVYTSCNVAYTYKTSALITGFNCIEKAFAKKETPQSQ